LINGGVVEIDVKNNELTFNVIEIMPIEKTKVEEAESDEGLQD
jgi:hypothetical protein